MPSKEYKRYLAQAQPAQTQKPPQTPQQRRQNWWYYNKKWIFVGLVVVAVVLFGVHDFATRPNPDYEILYVSTQFLPPQQEAQIRAALLPYCADRNGDGKVELSILNCQVGFGEQDEIDPQTQMANVTRLMAEAQDKSSKLVLTHQPQQAQEVYYLLREGEAVPWQACPLLAQAAQGDFFAGLYIGWRSGTQTDGQPSEQQLFAAVTQGMA